MVDARGLQANMPDGWHIRATQDFKGNVRVEVVHGVAREGCQPTAVETDLAVVVEYDAPARPWWKFWVKTGDFRARFQAAMDQCKRRAWELNERKNGAKRLIYEIENNVQPVG